jgi:hypothetical protein
LANAGKPARRGRSAPPAVPFVINASARSFRGRL